MPSEISRHALARMTQRGITIDDLEHALAHPTGHPTPGQLGSIWVYGKVRGGRILKVCVSTADPNVIITAAWPGA